jgi:hypothetical protein
MTAVRWQRCSCSICQGLRYAQHTNLVAGVAFCDCRRVPLLFGHFGLGGGKGQVGQRPFKTTNSYERLCNSHASAEVRRFFRSSAVGGHELGARAMLDCRARTRPVLQHPPGVRIAARRRRDAVRRGDNPQLELVDVRAPRPAEAGAHPRRRPARLGGLLTRASDQQQHACAGDA